MATPSTNGRKLTKAKRIALAFTALGEAQAEEAASSDLQASALPSKDSALASQDDKHLTGKRLPIREVPELGLDDPQITSLQRRRLRSTKCRLEQMPQVYKALLARIRMGAFPHVAAQSLGISNHAFNSWMRKGEATYRGWYRRFYQDVIQAASEARLVREIHVAQHDPLSWLKLGPGKTTKEQEGWTERKLTDTQITQEVNITEVQKQESMSDAMQVLKDLGFIQFTEEGQQVFEALPAPSQEENLSTVTETKDAPLPDA